MRMQSLQDAFIEELRDLYSAEGQLIKALPKLARAATNADLRAGFEEHLEQTRSHKERLERIFEELGQKPRATTCEGMQGILTEGERQIKSDADDATMDVALIGAAQKAEHYEIAAYGTVRTWARTLGLDEAARLLQQTLDEEEQADRALTELATTHVNAMAAAGEEEGEAEEEHEAQEEEEHEEIEGMMADAEEEEEEGVYIRGSRGRTGNPTTTGRGNAGSRNPASKPTRRTTRRRERSTG